MPSNKSRKRKYVISVSNKNRKVHQILADVPVGSASDFVCQAIIYYAEYQQNPEWLFSQIQKVAKSDVDPELLKGVNNIKLHKFDMEELVQSLGGKFVEDNHIEEEEEEEEEVIENDEPFIAFSEDEELISQSVQPQKSVQQQPAQQQPAQQQGTNESSPSQFEMLKQMTGAGQPITEKENEKNKKFNPFGKETKSYSLEEGISPFEALKNKKL